MDLWIRTQDRMNLVQVNQVNVNYENNKQIIANFVPDFIGKEGCYYEMLGTYKSKERALEVLDEIQEILYPNIQYNAKLNLDESLLIGWECNLPIITNNGASIVQPLNNYVYKMPKE